MPKKGQKSVDEISAEKLLRANINNETSTIAWNDLQTFFAQGILICVNKPINLLEVAVAFSTDNRDRVEKWLCAGDIFKVDVNHAKKWHDENQLFWANVVKPWILIQAC